MRVITLKPAGDLQACGLIEDIIVPNYVNLGTKITRIAKSRLLLKGSVTNTCSFGVSKLQENRLLPVIREMVCRTERAVGSDWLSVATNTAGS